MHSSASKKGAWVIAMHEDHGMCHLNRSWTTRCIKPGHGAACLSCTHARMNLAHHSAADENDSFIAVLLVLHMQ